MEATCFIGLWMLIGFAFNLDGTIYLLVGLPLTLLFQLLVAKSTVRSLWVRLAPPFRLRELGSLAVTVASALAVGNLLLLAVFAVTV